MADLGIFSPTEPATTLPSPDVPDTEPEPVNPLSLDLDQISPSQQQPRRYFDPQKMQELIYSIQEHGILEPLLVRPRSEGSYELVAGERRYRAAKELGLAQVPVVIRQLTDEEATQLALVENLQREDLNPVEETEGILTLLSMKLKISSDEVSQLLHRLARSSDNVVGNDRDSLEIIEAVFRVIGRIGWESFATHRLPLLKLPDPVLQALRSGQIEYTKARSIARVLDEQQRSKLLKTAIANSLSLNQIKQQIQQLQTSTSQSAADGLATYFTKRYADIGKKLKKLEVWNDEVKRQRLEELLKDLESLVR